MKRFEELKERQVRSDFFKKYQNKDDAGRDGARRFIREGGIRGTLQDDKKERRTSYQKRDNYEKDEPLRRVNK